MGEDLEELQWRKHMKCQKVCKSLDPVRAPKDDQELEGRGMDSSKHTSLLVLAEYLRSILRRFC